MKQLIVILIFFALKGTAQEAVQWISFEELPEKMRVEKKPVLLFFYTDWCKYCQLQKSTTFEDKTIVNKLNTSYYPIKVNGETTEAISFLGRKYQYNPSTKTHEFLEQMMQKDGKLTFPTTTFISKDLSVVVKKEGYISQEVFEELIE